MTRRFRLPTTELQILTQQQKIQQAEQRTQQTHQEVLSHAEGLHKKPLINDFSFVEIYKMETLLVVKELAGDGSDPGAEALTYPSGISFLAIPYLPYFTNCQYYGSFVYLPAIFETHPRCDLKTTAEVSPVGSFSFGAKPVADSCENIVLQCL